MYKMEKIQFLQTTPDQLSEKLFKQFKSLLIDFKNSQISKNSDELMTRAQVCEFLQIDSSTLWAWTKKGKLKGYGIGHRRYYKRKEILESLKPISNQTKNLL